MYTIIQILITSVLINGIIAIENLRQYNVDAESITVSGFSAGAAMAVQFHFANSKLISGAGVFAGGPYLCGYDGGLVVSIMCMQTPQLIPLDGLIRKTYSFGNDSKIDDPMNLKGDKVYIFHGKGDAVVRQGSGINAMKMYHHFGADVHAEFGMDVKHILPTIENSGYYGTYEMLRHLYGEENILKPEESSDEKLGNLYEFDQRDFFNWPGLYSMDNTGYIYIPSGCKDGLIKCRLHVAFHGCKGYRKLVGDGYVRKYGYLELAELNNIIMLFPQAQSSIIPPNPDGCFDWFKYTGSKFPTKDGAQISGIYRMIKKIVEG